MMVTHSRRTGVSPVVRALCLLLWLMVGAGEAFGQPDTLWTRQYEMHYGYDFIAVGDTGFAITGSSGFIENNRRYDFHLLLTDSSGRQIWDKVLIDTGDWNSRVRSICINDDSIFLIGYGGTPSGGSALIARLTTAGDSLWMLPFGGLRAALVTSVFNPEGGVFSAGGTYELNEYGGGDAYLLTVNENGDENWHRVYGGGGNDFFWDMIRTSDGGFALAGQTGSFGGGIQFYLVKTDSAGEEEWSGAYGGENTPDVAAAIRQLPDGGFVMAGWTYPSEGTSNDMMVIRVNAEGEEMWQRQYGDSINTERFNDLVVLPDGDIVILGNSSDRPTARLMRISPDGEVRWEGRYDRLSRGILDCYALLRLEDGSYVFAGTRSAGAFMVKTEPDTTNFNGVPILIDPAFPSSSSLSSPFPSPFNSSLTIPYSLSHPGIVRIAMFDLAGREVAVLSDRNVDPPGKHEVSWQAGSHPAGEYLIRLEAGGKVETRKALLLK